MEITLSLVKRRATSEASQFGCVSGKKGKSHSKSGEVKENNLLDVDGDRCLRSGNCTCLMAVLPRQLLIKLLKAP